MSQAFAGRDGLVLSRVRGRDVAGCAENVPGDEIGERFAKHGLELNVLFAVRDGAGPESLMSTKAWW